MDLEFEQLDLRYECLRVLNPRRERKLLASIGDTGQIAPISVVRSDGLGETASRHVVIDGFARVRVARRLGCDTVRAIKWDLTELEALLVVRSLRASERETILEQAWLLTELVQRFDLDQEELAQRFDRSQSWVSRRLALVRELPESIHEQIRQGKIVAHAAAKYLVPMARADREDCERLARAISTEDLSTRDIGQLYVGWRDGSATTRARLIENPTLFLRVRRPVEAPAPSPEELDLRDALLKEVSVIGAAVRRAKQRLRGRIEDELTPKDLEDVSHSFRVVQREIWRLIEFAQQKKEPDAEPKHADGDPRAA